MLLILILLVQTIFLGYGVWHGLSYLDQIAKRHRLMEVLLRSIDSKLDHYPYPLPNYAKSSSDDL